MSNIWFCSDLHFGHKNIQRYRKDVKDECDNRQRIKDDWNEVVGKRDVVYVLGDAAFSMETISDFGELAGLKFLIRGNHDELNTSVYLKYFKEVYGIIKYKEFWLSHAPIHPDELRGRRNLHGHVHYHNVQQEMKGFPQQQDDPNYFNCCPENLWPTVNRALISLDEIRKDYADRYIRPGS